MVLLSDIDVALVREVDGNGATLVAEVDLTDDAGGPRCARVRPPVVRWSATPFG